MLKNLKPDFIKNLSDKLALSKATILVNYTGLGVKKQQELKQNLKTIGASMFVAKNTLFKLAAKDAKFPEEILTDTILSGQTAFITTEEDPIAPIQILAKFAKDNEVPKFKVGFVDGLFQDTNNLVRLSKLPSKNELYAQVVGSMSSPMYGIVSTMQGNIQKLLYILKAKQQSN